MKAVYWVAFLFLVSVLSGQAQTKRALLIGINQYHPQNSQWTPPPAAGHKPDSRFAEGRIAWNDLKGPSNDVQQMSTLLKSFGFEDMSILREPSATVPGQPAATRQGILDAVRALAAKTQSGDVVVFYYSGHGSRRLDTTRNDPGKGAFDDTIVPADAYQGVFDITDKELAREFNRILDEKHARLIAIFDSCNSGAQARGLTAGVARTLPYDDRDIKNDPEAYTGVDLKHVPKDGNAVILSAASPVESAQDAWYPDDGQYHGAFTRALVKVLKANPNLRAVDIVNSVDWLMRADGLPPQQPSVEGRVNEPLFGGLVAQPLRATVANATGGTIRLNVGSLAGFGINTTFRLMNATSDITLTITKVDGPISSTASVSPAGARIGQGETAELTNMVYPDEAKLRIFVPSNDWDPEAASATRARALFSGFEWKDDPALNSIQYLVTYYGHEWKATDLNGQEISPSAVRALAASGKPRSAFLAIPPTRSLVASLGARPAFKSGGFVISDQIAGSHYLLLGRQNEKVLEYALFRPSLLGSRPAPGYVESSMFDKIYPDTNGPEKGIDSKVVCGQSDSFPVRSEWVQLAAARGNDGVGEAAVKIEEIGKRIAKLRAWMELLGKNEESTWPYQLEIETKSGESLHNRLVLAPGTSYRIALVAEKGDLSSTSPVTAQFVYVIGIDCSAHLYLLYPDLRSNGGAAIPQQDADNSYPSQIVLSEAKIGTPFGADSIFLLTTPTKITDLGVFGFNGVVGPSVARGNGLGDLIERLGDISPRGWTELPSHWTVQHVTIRSF